ncbi:MAG: cytochrome c oxidase accessory protein CcoG [Steroidobacteraceae bacterium]
MSDPAGVEKVGFYAAHQKVYPREVTGRFARLRDAAMIVLLGFFYLMPWVRWSGRQALLFDMPARKFYIFGLTFFPQDFFLLTWLLVIAALSLFFFTALAGRLWCGYACPQTVWTEAFIWMERLTEGKRGQRMKLDKGPWNAQKILRKSAKQVLWVAFSAWTGFTFVGFFVPIRELGAGILAGSLSGWALFWVVFYGFATYGNAGFLREQVCLYMCPYARFQSAMFDRNTLIISYDVNRGEPRGARARGSDYKKAGLGDCVDCTVCVQACPTGIDIRKGLQYECIACAACIDACDAVMDKVGLPRGLIRYSTQNEMDGAGTHVVRPRVLLYGLGLALLLVGFFVAVSVRSLVDLDVLRDRNALYRELNDGRIENVFTVRIINKDQHAHEFVLEPRGLPGAQIDTDSPRQRVAPEEVKTVVVRVRAEQHDRHGGQDFVVLAQATDDPKLTAKSRARFFFEP